MAVLCLLSIHHSGQILSQRMGFLHSHNTHHHLQSADKQNNFKKKLLLTYALAYVHRKLTSKWKLHIAVDIL